MRTREGNKENDILEAAIQIFAEAGYHGSKISKIAEVAGVANGSVYLYFRNKQDILVKILEKLWEKLAKDIQKLVDQTDLDPLEKIDGMVDKVFDTFTSNPNLAIVVINEHNQMIQRGVDDFAKQYEKFLDACRKVFSEGVDHAYINPDLDVKVFLHFVVGGLRHLINLWAGNPDLLPLQKMRDNIKYLIRHGVIKW